MNSHPRGDGEVVLKGDVHLRRDLPVVMRDGVVLRADVFRGADRDGRRPAILVRTPYDKSVYTALGEMYAAAGYIAVLQDVRGQFASDGEWRPFVLEGDDGVDTLDWVLGLPEVDGRVSMIGSSYVAYCAWQIAARRPGTLAAMVTAMTPVDVSEDWLFPGGAFSLAFTSSWLLNNVARTAVASLPDGAARGDEMARAYEGLMEEGYFHLPVESFPPLHPERSEVAGYFFDWLRGRGAGADEIAPASMSEHIARVETPVLHVGGWYDPFVESATKAHRSMLGGAGGCDRSRLVVGPWAHNSWGRGQADVDFGAEANFSFQGVALDWVARHLALDRARPQEPGVRYFDMGARQWCDSEHWPPEEAVPTSWFLTSDGPANAASGHGSLRRQPPVVDLVDRAESDPLHPVPSLGGQSCCFPQQSPIGPRDQRPVEALDDVLTYSSEVLTDPVRVAGPVEAILYVAGSTPARDVTAKLVDVHPDGRAINLTEGIVRIGTTDSPEPALSGDEVRAVTVHLHPTATTFATGHRIRLEVSGCNFPTYDRNPGTGQASWSARTSDMVVAEHRLHHGPSHPSRLIVHTLPG